MVAQDVSLEVLRCNYVKEQRQVRLTIGVVGFLSIMLIALFGFITIVLDSNSGTQESSEQSRYALPCVKSDDHPFAPPSITLRVLNGTNMSGYATAVAKSLEYRGFSIAEIDSTDSTNITTIRYGKNAYRQAYTLIDHFSDAIMVLDSREDGLIDVVIGRSFAQLQDEVLVKTLDTSVALTSPTKCSLIDNIIPQTELEHDDTLVPAYDENGLRPTESTSGAETGETEGSDDDIE